MKWQPFAHKGCSYDLSHLDPFYWNYTAKAGEKRPERMYKFQVSFSMHCFTRDPFPDEQINEVLWYKELKEKRLFCFNRYGYSRQLPAIIKSMGERTCWHTHHDNFFTIELMSEQGRTIEYEVYFDVTKATRQGGWLNLVVQSAYERTDDYASLQPRKKKIRLDVIAYNKQSGKKIRRPI